MNEKIPKHIILDLLPLYFSNEISDESRALLKECLTRDPQLSKLVEQAGQATFLQDIPKPLKKENEMEAFKKARKLMIQHNVFLTVAVIQTCMVGISFAFFWDGNHGAAVPFVFGGLALFFWIAFFLVNRRIED